MSVLSAVFISIIYIQLIDFLVAVCLAKIAGLYQRELVRTKYKSTNIVGHYNFDRDLAVVTVDAFSLLSFQFKPRRATVKGWTKF